MGENGLRALVGAVGFIVFLLVGILTNSAPSVPSTGNFGFNSGKDVNLFHASKRKVPNGPDPIHNRKSETSRQPPRV